MTNDSTGPHEPNPWGQPPQPNPWGQPQQPPAQPQQQPQQPAPLQQPAQPQQQPYPAEAPAQPYIQQPPAQQTPPYAPQPGAYSQQATAAYPTQPTAAGGYPPQPPAGAYPAGSPAPAPAPRKKKSLVPWIASGSVVLLLLIGGIVGFNLGSAAHAPELQVKAYLDALKKGDVAAAFDVVGTKVEKSDLLLTKKAYAEADDRITRYTLGDVVTEDETARVTASITQGGEKYDHEFTLSKVGKDAVIFDTWKLEAPELSSIAVGANAPNDAVVEVAGVDVSGLEKEGGVYTLRALPGTYSVALGGEASWYAAEELQASVVGFGGDADSPEPSILEIAMTEEGTTAATDAVTAWLDACIASTELVPTGCAFFATNSQGYELSGITWTVTKPTFTIGEFADGSWPVTTDSKGNAQAAADARDPSNGATGRISTDEFSFDIDGVIEAFGEDGATFVYAP
ncbi:hypothetical protein L1277_000063 [Okibacterium sp. HSC-33S16]|uniref:hypothetical protein n=1 Tax=Okibacterium sp. HSC-33S16 TaxID=2910965 RepID=UPI00209C9BD6|nr:hypothetical protein [Okibacterium sp. HSC-33S16]MCP2029999.1 hypothetical protein [Okibacterium sp. HSC-33S16]